MLDRSSPKTSARPEGTRRLARVRGYLDRHAGLGAIWFATAASALLGFVASVALARTLSVQSYGALAACLTATAIAATVANYGIGAFWLRVFGLEGDQAQRWIAPSLKLVALLTVATIGMLAATTPAIFPETLNQTLLSLLLPLIAMQVVLDLAQARAQLEASYGRVGLIQLVPNLNRAIAAIFAVVTSATVMQTAGLLAALCVATCIVAAGSLVAAVDKGVQLPSDRQQTGRIAAGNAGVLAVGREAFPFALASVSYPLYFQSNLLTLSIVGDNHAAGLFGVAFVVITALYLLPAVTYQKYLNSKMHWWAENDPDKLRDVHRRGVFILGAAGLLIGATLVMLAPWIVTLLFGRAFEDAGDILRVLALAVPFRFLSAAMGGVLLTGTMVRRRALYEVAAALVTITLGISLIPELGALGAAIASVISEIVLCTLYTLAARPFWSARRV